MCKGKTKTRTKDESALEAKPVDQRTAKEATLELKRLAQVIAYHDGLYYRRATPGISEASYDALRERNAAIEVRFPKIMRKDSPSLRIGAPPASVRNPVRSSMC
jgi:DNA ligase (NAD+)